MKLWNWLFELMWRRRLEGRKVVRVKGLRTALVQDRCYRYTTAFMIKVAGHYF